MLVYRRIIFVLVIFLLMNIFLIQGGESESEEDASLRNPFESWFHVQEREEAKRRKEQIVQEVPPNEASPPVIEFKLTGILQGKRNLAIINGEVVGEGDIIEDKKVVQIVKKRVTLRGMDDAKVIVLEMKDEF